MRAADLSLSCGNGNFVNVKLKSRRLISCVFQRFFYVLININLIRKKVQYGLVIWVQWISNNHVWITKNASRISKTPCLNQHLFIYLVFVFLLELIREFFTSCLERCRSSCTLSLNLFFWTYDLISNLRLLLFIWSWRKL